MAAAFWVPGKTRDASNPPIWSRGMDVFRAALPNPSRQPFAMFNFWSLYSSSPWLPTRPDTFPLGYQDVGAKVYPRFMAIAERFWGGARSMGSEPGLDIILALTVSVCTLHIASDHTAPNEQCLNRMLWVSTLLGTGTICHWASKTRRSKS